MKSAIAVFLFVLLSVGLVSADPQMNTEEGYCHFVKEAANTNNETFVGSCVSSIDVDNGVASGYVKVYEWLPKKVSESRYAEYFTSKGIIKVTSDESDTPCALVVDGNNYASNDWVSITRVKRGIVIHELTCDNGAQQ